MIELRPLSAILALSVDEQDKLAREVCRVEKKATDATEAHKLSFPMAGKVVYAVQKRLEQLKSPFNPDGTAKKPSINQATSLAQYWESITKANGKQGVKLNNHWLSCAVCFGTYVASELITEADYDKNPAANLELAASISTAVGGDVTHAAVMSAAEELRDRSKNSAKNLREILASVKEPKEMTVERATEIITSVIGAGHLEVVIACVGAEIAHIDDSEKARSAFFGLSTASDLFAANMETVKAADGKPTQKRRFPDKVLNAWAKAYDKAQEAPAENTLQITPAQTPTPVETTAVPLAADA